MIREAFCCGLESWRYLHAEKFVSPTYLRQRFTRIKMRRKERKIVRTLDQTLLEAHSRFRFPEIDIR